jgi:hypothetical protein
MIFFNILILFYLFIFLSFSFLFLFLFWHKYSILLVGRSVQWASSLGRTGFLCSAGGLIMLGMGNVCLLSSRASVLTPTGPRLTVIKYSLRPKLLECFYWNTNIKEFVRNL